MDCIFCNIDKDKIILQNEFAFAVYDKYPHSKGHLLIIPFRHFESYFDASKEEQDAMTELLNKAKGLTDIELKPNAYNVNINCGSKAGQIIKHAHIHLIPRY